jgi:hypothetical protein
LRRHAISPTEYSQPRLTLSNEPLGISGSEGSPTTQEKDRFEQRGLSRPVTAPDKIPLWVQCQFGALEAS